MVAALTMLKLDEMIARYASYEDLAEIIRLRFKEPVNNLRELYGRLTFNILCGNKNDHARNHAAFWNGRSLTLTPAYDICPQARASNKASQAMLISGQNRMSQLRVCLDAAPAFLLKPNDAYTIVKNQLVTIIQRWDAICARRTGTPRPAKSDILSVADWKTCCRCRVHFAESSCA